MPLNQMQVQIQPQDPNAQQTQVPGLSAHDQAMLDKANGSQSGAKLADKYATEEELDKASYELFKKGFKSVDEKVAFYKNLEKGLGSGKIDVQAAASQVTPQSTQQTATQVSTQQQTQTLPQTQTPPADAGTAVQNAGLDFTKLVDEYRTNGGKLADASYASFEKAGIPRQMIDQYIRGQEAEAQLITNTATEIAGGQDQLQTMFAWAAINIPKDEIAVINAQLAGGLAQAKVAMTALKARYVEENGNPPKGIVMGDTYAPNSGDIFTNMREVMDVMRTPEYKTNQTFRNQVHEKMYRSQKAGKLMETGKPTD